MSIISTKHASKGIQKASLGISSSWSPVHRSVSECLYMGYHDTATAASYRLKITPYRPLALRWSRVCTRTYVICNNSMPCGAARYTYSVLYLVAGCRVVAKTRQRPGRRGFAG